MPSDAKNVALLEPSTSTLWELWGRTAPNGEPQRISLTTMTYTVGRNPQSNLVLTYPTVSQYHASFDYEEGMLRIRDCGSTNGTFVNGNRLTKEAFIRENDCLQFGTASFIAHRRSDERVSATVGADVSLNALAQVEFGRLIDDPAVKPYFQPIVNLASQDRVGFEVLARSFLAGLQFPSEMFRIATERGRQVELSVIARQEGMAAAEAYGLFGKLFVNTHPDELIDAASLLLCMEQLRTRHPLAEIVVEIHEASIASFSGLSELRRRLTEFGIGLAFDDFGAGQSRLLEITSVKPDYIKFDRSLISRIDQAKSDRVKRVKVLRSLVGMVVDLGITPLAEGIETFEEADACLQCGFELAQGYLYGRPLPAADWASARTTRQAAPSPKRIDCEILQ